MKEGRSSGTTIVYFVTTVTADALNGQELKVSNTINPNQLRLFPKTRLDLNDP